MSNAIKCHNAEKIPSTAKFNANTFEIIFRFSFYLAVDRTRMKMEIIFLLLFITSQTNSQKIKLNFNCGELHGLYDEGKHLVNLRRLYDNILRRNHVTISWNEIGYAFFNSEFSQPINFNISEEYLKARVLT